MDKFKNMLKDHAFMKGSFFIVFNAVLLYVIYFILKNIRPIASWIVGCLDVLVDAFWPLILGLILAYLLNPLSELIDSKVVCRLIRLPEDPIKAEKRKNLAHFISVVLTYILVIAAVLAIIYGFAVMIIGKVVFRDLSTLVQDLLYGIVQYEDTFRSWIANVAANLPDGVLSDKLGEVANVVMHWISENINASSVITFFSSIGGSVVNVLIGIIISIYLMKDKQFFLGLWRKFLHLVMPQKGNAVLTETLSEVNDVLSKFIRGALLDALIVAILSSIGLTILGLEASVFIGVFAGICNVIPYFGPVMGMIPAFLMGLCTDGLLTGIIAAAILVAVQQIDSNIIYPKIVGSSTGLHPLMVLLAVSVFGYFFGIIGMLLAVPLAGIIQVFVVKWAESKERKNSSEAPETSDESSGAEADE